MGLIGFDGAENFVVTFVHLEDAAVLRAASKATPGTGTPELTDDPNVVWLEVDNPSNVIALWAADFQWDAEAIKPALDQIAPLAWQQVGIFSRATSRMINKQSDKHLGDLRTQFETRKKSGMKLD